ncbi:hypothetical protein HDE_12120 [Halotydeus destructor]|nr:hypothetical protein HDE_12120 [Halotydeus destructor]
MSTTTTTTATTTPESSALNESLKEEIETSGGVSQLKHVPEPEVKLVLPSADDIAHEKVLHDIEHKRVSLNKVETVEKVVLPTSEDILKEKATLE